MKSLYLAYCDELKKKKHKRKKQMTKKQLKEYRKSKEFLDSISFSELVKAIDAKWGHTYQDVTND
jgi:hypothetical protein